MWEDANEQRIAGPFSNPHRNLPSLFLLCWGQSVNADILFHNAIVDGVKNWRRKMGSLFSQKHQYNNLSGSKYVEQSMWGRKCGLSFWTLRFTKSLSPYLRGDNVASSNAWSDCSDILQQSFFKAFYFVFEYKLEENVCVPVHEFIWALSGNCWWFEFVLECAPRENIFVQRNRHMQHEVVHVQAVVWGFF